MVRSRHEQVVRQALLERRIHHLLPVYRSVRQWKDRRKELELALFPGYIFIHFDVRKRVEVLKIPGVVQLLGYGTQPLAIPEDEIAPFRRSVEGGVQLLPHPFLRSGRRVRVHSGPLAGIEGILLRRKDRLRLLISIEMLMRSAVVELDEDDVTPLEC